MSGGGGGGAEITYDLVDPLAQALVLRAYLATVGELRTDARGACHRLHLGPRSGRTYPTR